MEATRGLLRDGPVIGVRDDGIVMKTIVAALDFSDASDAVVKTAEKLASAFGAKLDLVHILEPQPAYTVYGFTPGEVPALHAFEKEAKVRAAEKLEGYRVHVQGVDVNNLGAHVLQGLPASTLLKYAEEQGADLVVLGTHGHGMIAGVLLGSVADALVRKARVPTLVVPAGEQ